MRSPTATPVAGPAVIAGTVHGGQTPVAGARIFLFEATTAGYGNLAKSDVMAANGTLDTTYNAYYTTTDATGSFGLTGKYTCTAGAQMYLLATQGNPGLAAGKNNAALAEMAALGPCPSGGVLSPTLNLVISEASTVASVYALAGYMTAPNAVSRANTTLAQTGLANAFATAGNLATQNGYAIGTTPGSNNGGSAGFNVVGTAPTAKINLLANILAACVNSDGTGTPCSTLFANATSNGTSGTVPADTVTALLNIAHNPGANVAALYSLASASGPFQPTTTTQPNDLTLAVGYTATGGGAVAQPTLQAISIDAAGNVVIPFNNNTVTFTGALTNTGAVLSSDYASPSGTVPIQYALDGNGNAWTAVGNLSSRVGALVRYTVASGGRTSYTTTDAIPVQVAIDAQGRIVVADPAVQKVQVFNTDGTLFSTPLLGVYPHVAADASGNLITLGAQVNTVYVNGVGFTGGGLNYPGNLALDGVGAVWLANANGSNTLSRFQLSGSGSGATATAISPASGYSGGGLKTSTNSNYAPVMMDGASNAWYANYDTGSVSRFSNAGVAISPSTGYALADHPEGLAIDGSGNVWVTVNNGFGTSPVLYELIGAAVPVATPVLPGQFGVRP